MQLIAVVVALGLALASLDAEAQESRRVARVGWLSADRAVNPHFREAFLQGLRDLGDVEGRDVVMEYRDAEGNLERLLTSLARPGGNVTGLSMLFREVVTPDPIQALVS